MIDPPASTHENAHLSSKQRFENSPVEETKSEAAASRNGLLVFAGGGGLLVLVLGIVLFATNHDWFGNAQRQNQLKRIHLSYSSYVDANNKAPKKLDELRPYLDQDCRQAIDEGKYTIVWNVRNYRKAENDTKFVLAFETEAKKSAGFVIYSDFEIAHLDKVKLESAFQESPRK